MAYITAQGLREEEWDCVEIGEDRGKRHLAWASERRLPRGGCATDVRAWGRW